MVASTDRAYKTEDEDADRPQSLLRRIGLFVADLMPKGLYGRALIIIIAPIVLLESILAFIFMEAHWESVTRRLSESTARDISAIVRIYENYTRDDNYKELKDLAWESLRLQIQVLPPGALPPPRPRPFFALLDRALSKEIRRRVRKPYWIDTVGSSRLVEIRIKLANANLSVFARRSQTYASNSHIFLVWMVVTSLILLTVAILFLRNQIKPILNLSEAADALGKGRPVPDDFRPRGAREVRQAAAAFLEMRDRIEKHVEQRTTMLAGVSHDLRTILTRFKLQLAMLGDGPKADALRSDVDEMQLMLEDYMAFTKGDNDGETQLTKVYPLVKEVRDDGVHLGTPIELKVSAKVKGLSIPLRRHAMKRAFNNLVNNAARFGTKVLLTAIVEDNLLKITVEDDGPGIELAQREEVFRPFYRIDNARNQDIGHTGLGLSIARDIAHNHGGEISLGESQLGGLRAVIAIPI